MRPGTEVGFTPGLDTLVYVFHHVFPEDQRSSEAALYFSVLAGLAIPLKPKVIVEIGTQYALSTRAFLVATEQQNGIVHSIDIDAECGRGRNRENIHSIGAAHRWFFHHGRSQDIEPRDCDLLYVDGDHGYPSVCSDMARHGVKVRDGGLVILDDYHQQFPGKMQWIDERWEHLDPILIGPTAVVRVTPEKRRWFAAQRRS